MMEDSDLDHLRDTPGFKPILRAILKSQMKHLVEQLSKHGGEEAMVLTASISDASFNHLGSTATEGFLDSRDDIMAQFLGYCTKGVQENEDHNEIERSADDRFKDKVSPGTTSKNSSRPVSSAKQPSKSVVCPVSLIKVGEKTATEMDVQQTAGSKAGSTISSSKSGRGGRKRPSATVSSDKPPKRSTISKTVTQALKAISADTGQEMEEETCGSVKVESDHGDPDFTKTEDSDSSDTLSLDLGSGTKDRHDIIKEFSETEQPGQSFDLDDLTEVKVEPADDDEVPDFEEDTDQLDFDVDTEAAAAEDGARSTETATKIEETNTTSADNVCESCGRRYKSKWSLKRHMVSHRIVPSLRCETCDIQFPEKHDLNEHIQVKHQLQKIVCEICGQQFSSRSGKHNHLKTHLYELEYKCDLCEKAFVCKSRLDRHLVSHSRSSSFCCTGCGKMFKYRSSLNRHECKSSEDPKQFMCPVCGKIMGSSVTMNNHMRMHRNEAKFQCTHCGMSFVWRWSFLRHVKRCEVKNS